MCALMPESLDHARLAGPRQNGRVRDPEAHDPGLADPERLRDPLVVLSLKQWRTLADEAGGGDLNHNPPRGEGSSLRLWLVEAAGLRVHPVSAGDAGLLVRFFAALSESSRATFRPHPFTEEAAAEVVRAVEKGRTAAFLAVTGDGEPVVYGFLSDLRLAKPTLGVAVADGWQDRGLGRGMVEHLVEVARRLGRRGVQLTVDDANVRAIRLYEAAGFREVRTIRQMRLTFPPSDLGGPPQPRGGRG